MKDETFRLRPVRRYSQARYGSESGENLVAHACWLARFFPRKMVGKAIALLLAGGLALGVSACLEDPAVNFQEDGDTDGEQVDGDMDGTLCESDGLLRCGDDANAWVCKDGAEEEIDCNEFCKEKYGADFISYGCDDTDEDNFCQCDYDMIEGVAPECQPGDLMCVEDNGTLAICTDEYYFEYVDCDTYCVEEYGPDFISMGCNVEADEPCQCEYGVLPGEPVECFVGEEGCLNATDLTRCIPYGDEDPADHEGEPGYMESITCDDYCAETYGPDWYSPLGCQEDDPDENGELCNCEYGIIDGDIAECYVGEEQCISGTDLLRCVPFSEGSETGYPESIDCNDYCAETYGLDWYSALGCQADDPDENGELCNCEYGMMDGMIPNECGPTDPPYCDPYDNLVRCEYGEGYGYWVTVNCADQCDQDTSTWISEGCNADDADDPCQCSAPDKKNK